MCLAFNSRSREFGSFLNFSCITDVFGSFLSFSCITDVFGSFLSFSCITYVFLLHPNILKDLAQLTILVNPGYYF